MGLSLILDDFDAADDYTTIDAHYCHESRIVRVYVFAHTLVLWAGVPGQGGVNWSVLILDECFVDGLSQYSRFVMIQHEFGRDSTLRI